MTARDDRPGGRAGRIGLRLRPGGAADHALLREMLFEAGGAFTMLVVDAAKVRGSPARA
jgi:hypothetical protein